MPYPGNLRHGYSRTSTHTIWKNMKARCNNLKDTRYGGRGVKVCKRWLKFENFLEDMGERPSSSHSIERNDNNLGYRKENCRWATATDQANNRRSNRVIEFSGRSQTLAQWSKETKIKVPALFARLKSGWTIERALTEPTNNRGQNNAQ